MRLRSPVFLFRNWRLGANDVPSSRTAALADGRMGGRKILGEMSCGACGACGGAVLLEKRREEGEQVCRSASVSVAYYVWHLMHTGQLITALKSCW